MSDNPQVSRHLPIGVCSAEILQLYPREPFIKPVLSCHKELKHPLNQHLIKKVTICDYIRSQNHRIVKVGKDL